MADREVALTPRLVEPPPRPVASWWRAPLPAWAQAAAAVLVFGAGLSVGLAQGTPAPEAAAAAVEPVVAGVSPAELAALEERLRADFTTAAPRPGPVVAAALSDDAEQALLRRVQDIVEESAVEQRIELTERLVEFGRSVENQRRADLGFYSTALNRYQSEASTEIRQHREAIDQLRRVSLPGR
jgi:hypothetical protein